MKFNQLQLQINVSCVMCNVINIIHILCNIKGYDCRKDAHMMSHDCSDDCCGKIDHMALK